MEDEALEPTADGPRPGARFAFECATCGATSDNPAAYQKRKRSRRREETICLPCHQAESLEHEIRAGRWELLIGLPAIVAVWLFPDSIAAIFGWSFINFLVFPSLLVPITVAVHELGHWSAAHALGLRIHEISVGGGRLLWTRHFGGMRIRWRRHALMGHVRVSLPNRRLARTRYAAMVLAGPATHLVWIALALWLASLTGVLGEGTLRVGTATDGFNPLVGIVFLSGIQLVGNLIPAQVGENLTDGAQLLSTPFLEDADLDWLLEAQWAIPGEIALGEGACERAESLAREGLEHYPDSLVLNLLLAGRFATGGDWERALLILRPLHAREGLDPVARAAIANAVAWCLTNRDDESDLRERNALLSEAERHLGVHAPILSTRGAALLADGRPSEAWPLLANSLSKLDEIDHRATVLCNLARAEHRLTLTDQARRRVAEARALNPGNALLPLAEGELARAPRTESQPRAADARPARAIELPVTTSRQEPDRRPRLPRSLWLAVPTGLLLWSCGPPYLEAMLMADVPYYDLTHGPPSDAKREACAAGLDKLDRWDWALSRLSYGGIEYGSWREIRIAHLATCIGQTARAREVLERIIAEHRSLLGPDGLGTALDADGTGDFERYSAAITTFEVELLLAHLKHEVAHQEQGSDPLQAARELATQLDLAWKDHPELSYRSRVLRIEIGRIEREQGAASALARLEKELAALSRGHTLLERIPLMTLQAELLEKVGRTQEAERIWARVGRAGQAAMAMVETEN